MGVKISEYDNTATQASVFSLSHWIDVSFNTGSGLQSQKMNAARVFQHNGNSLNENTVIGTNDAFPLLFRAGVGTIADKEAMRIDTSGRVGIGTLADALTRKFTVKGTGIIGVFVSGTNEHVRLEDGVADGGVIVGYRALNNVNTNTYFFFDANNGTNARVRYGGISGQIAANTTGNAHKGRFIFHVANGVSTGQLVTPFAIDSDGDIASGDGLGLLNMTTGSNITNANGVNGAYGFWRRVGDLNSVVSLNLKMNNAANSAKITYGRCLSIIRDTTAANEKGELQLATRVGSAGLSTGLRVTSSLNTIISNGSEEAEVASAKLQVNSTTQGFLPPRMTAAQRDAIASPVAGLIIYNTTTNKLNVYTTTWEAITSL